MRQADWCKQHTTLHANIVDFVFYKKKKLKSAPIYQTDNFPKTKVTVKDTNSSIFFSKLRLLFKSCGLSRVLVACKNMIKNYCTI